MSLEMGKIKTEGVGEVQEFVDIVSCCLMNENDRLRADNALGSATML